MPIFVVFGIGAEAEKRASRFTERATEPALKAATLLGLREAWTEDEATRTVPEALPERDMFGHGNGDYVSLGCPE